MSGSGKTYWSEKLRRKGFRMFSCDDLIEKRLGRELRSLGFSGINDVARWMGQPFDARYKHTSQKYLKFEKAVMKKVLKMVGRCDNNDNIVIDTTGSVIYTGSDILAQLCRLTTVIYLHTPLSVREKMYRLYIQDPKPVIWGNSFKKTGRQSNLAALKKYYPKLLAFRARQYAKLADITLNYHCLRGNDYSIVNFMKRIYDPV